MARRGRKKTIAKRPTTRVARGEVILPTDEQILKKAELLGIKIKGPVDVRKVVKVKADRPLDYLDIRGRLKVEKYDSQDLYNAGVKYAYLYWRKNGEPWPTRRDPATMIEDERRDHNLERAFNAQSRVLDGLGLNICRAFKRCVVDENYEPWVLDFICAGKESWQSQALLKGLAALVDFNRG